MDNIYTVAFNNYEFIICIDKTRYVYRSNDYTGYQLHEKFMGIYKHSPWKAVNWLKTNAELVNKY